MIKHRSIYLDTRSDPIQSDILVSITRHPKAAYISITPTSPVLFPNLVLFLASDKLYRRT